METLQTNVQLFKGKNFFQIFRTILLLNIWTWSEIYISQLTFCQKKKTSEGQNFQVSNVTESFPFFLFLRFCETMGYTHTHTHTKENDISHSTSKDLLLVVYFYQHLGVTHSESWSILAFSHVFARFWRKSDKKQGKNEPVFLCPPAFWNKPKRC